MSVELDLDPVAVRVLGSLVEKGRTTPDNYPLTLNALVAACNQASNRDPVMALDEDAVARALDDLRRRGLVRPVQRSDSRTTRYGHLAYEALNQDEAELAAMCVLMLRGPQTAGEIHTRTGRLFEYDDLAHVERVLHLLTLRQPSALVTRLPRRPGQKEVRYAHLLSGEVAAQAAEAALTASPIPAPPDAARVASPDGRVEALEREMRALREELSELKARFEAFRKEFQ